MTRVSFALVLSLLLPVTGSAHDFINGQRVAPVGISDKGELNYQQDSFSYRTEQRPAHRQGTGLAAHRRTLIGERENAALIEAIKQAKLPHDRYQTTTIINTDDAIPGTGMFVRSSIENNKSSIRGRSLSSTATASPNARQLEKGGSAVVVLDKDGRVRFVKDGALTQEEVQQVIALLHQLLN